MNDWLTIGQFAKKIGVTAKALRHYEELGLLKSHQRGENGYRYYQSMQISTGEHLKELKSLGFTLEEIKVLLAIDPDIDSDKLIAGFERRLSALKAQSHLVEQQTRQLQNILASLKRKTEPLTGTERRTIMKFFEQICIVVTGTDDLEKTAGHICTHLAKAGQSAAIVTWEGTLPEARPCIVTLSESQLATLKINELRPDVVVVRNVSDHSSKVIQNYLKLYGAVGPTMATVINADDRASIELAAQDIVRQGKIFYFSKNKGLEDQIEKIGGIVSDGTDVRIYGFNARVLGRPQAKENLTWPLGKILNFADEVALISSLAAVLDVGLSSHIFQKN